MSFGVPWALAGLLLIPLLVVGYRRLLARRRERLEALARAGLVPVVSSGGRARHVPAALFLGALTLLLIGAAEPNATVTELRREGIVVLAFDASNSMLADDLDPTRMEAAKAAARTFVADQPREIRIGVVAFSDSGVVTQTPTDSEADVLAAIDRMSPNGGTSLGQGIFAALKAIGGADIQVTEEQLAGNLDDLDIGYFGNARIILLSDGQNTADLDPQAVAELASVAGVSIETVGIGSPQGTTVTLDGVSQSTALDERTLTAIADVTDGTYHRASDAAGLTEIYDAIDLDVTTRRELTEITNYLVLGAMTLLLGGAITSILRTGRVVSA